MEKKNIYQKLVELQKRVRGLGKDSKAGGYGASYQYVSGSKVLSFIRPAMDELGLLLVQNVNEIENTRMDYATKNGNKTEVLCKVSMTFTWIDADSGEKLEVPFGANGMNGFDKGLGSALTYAERYFLLKFFHIATDEDDIDALKREEDAQPIPPAPAQRRLPRKLLVNSNAWKHAVIRLANGEEIRDSLANSYDMQDSDWEQLDQAVCYELANRRPSEKATPAESK